MQQVIACDTVARARLDLYAEVPRCSPTLRLSKRSSDGVIGNSVPGGAMNSRSKLLVGSAEFGAALGAMYSIAQDRATVVPGMKVLLENECVRVQYHDVAVGQTIPMHSHPSYVVYVLRSFRARITLPDGTQRISEHKQGEAYCNEPITHSVENLGSTDIHNLVVELKQGKTCH